MERETYCGEISCTNSNSVEKRKKHFKVRISKNKEIVTNQYPFLFFIVAARNPIQIIYHCYSVQPDPIISHCCGVQPDPSCPPLLLHVAACNPILYSIVVAYNPILIYNSTSITKESRKGNNKEQQYPDKGINNENKHIPIREPTIRMKYVPTRESAITKLVPTFNFTNKTSTGTNTQP